MTALLSAGFLAMLPIVLVIHIWWVSTGPRYDRRKGKQ